MNTSEERREELSRVLKVASDGGVKISWQDLDWYNSKLQTFTISGMRMEDFVKASSVNV